VHSDTTIGWHYGTDRGAGAGRSRHQGRDGDRLSRRHLDFERHLCLEILVALRAPGRRCLSPGLLDPAWRGDANNLQELSNGTVELVFVHLCSPLRRSRLEPGSRRTPYAKYSGTARVDLVSLFLSIPYRDTDPLHWRRGDRCD